MFEFKNPETLIREITEALGLNKFSEISNVRDYRHNLWAAANEAMRPHINGEMPAIIAASYPNESAEMLAYRHKIHRSKTKGLLQKAITGVKSNVIEKITYDCDQRVAEYLNQRRFKGVATDKMQAFNEFMREFYYPARVKDPNAVIAIKQNPLPTTDVTKEPELELEIYPSENVVAKTNEMVIVKLPINEKEYTSAYRFFGQFMQAVIYINKSSEAVVMSSQPYDNGVCPVCFLGGAITTEQTHSKESFKTTFLPFFGFNQLAPQTQIQYYSSDFAYALPLMDETENASNQAAIARVLTNLPIVVARELKCGTCEGKGTINKLDADGFVITNNLGFAAVEICPTCNGKKNISPLSNGVITVPHNENIHGEQQSISDIANSFVAYVSPPVQNTQQAETTAENCRKLLQDELNVTGTNFNFAQSAESKKESRKQKEEQLKEIAASVKRVYEFLLYNFSLFLSNAGRINSRQQMIEAIRVNLPTQFISVGADELESEFIDTQENLSNEQRDIELRAIMKNKKPAQTDKVDLYFNLCWDLSNGAWLYSKQEILDLMATGVLTNEDKIRAIKLSAYLYGLIFIQGKTNETEIETLANEFVARQLKSVQALVLPPLSDPNAI